MRVNRIDYEEIAVHYSADERLKAVVAREDDVFVVEFYKDEVILNTEQYPAHSVGYAQDAAENYTLGIKKIGD
jgi:hypothetical protein